MVEQLMNERQIRSPCQSSDSDSVISSRFVSLFSFFTQMTAKINAFLGHLIWKFFVWANQ